MSDVFKKRKKRSQWEKTKSTLTTEMERKGISGRCGLMSSLCEWLWCGRGFSRFRITSLYRFYGSFRSGVYGVWARSGSSTLDMGVLPSMAPLYCVPHPFFLQSFPFPYSPGEEGRRPLILSRQTQFNSSQQLVYGYGSERGRGKAGLCQSGPKRSV